MRKRKEDKTGSADNRVTLDEETALPAIPCIVHISDTLADTIYWLSAGKELKIGRAPENDLCIREMSVSQRHARVFMTAAGAVFIEDLGSTNGTYVGGEKVVRHALRDGDKIHIGRHQLLEFCFQTGDAPETTGSGAPEAARDALTGVYTRGYLLTRIEEDFVQARMRQRDLALLMFDIDGFEELRETHGPGMSDMVLREVATVVSSVLRREDVFARYDDHTFMVLLRNQTEEAVVVLAQRVGRVVKYHPFPHEGKNIRVTVSLGIGSLTRRMKNATELIDDVETYLEKSRRAGHDTINGSQSMRVIFRQMANRHVA